MGKVLIQTGELERALTHLKKVAQLSPDEATCHYLMAQAYRRLGKSAEEKAEIERFQVFRAAEQEKGKRPDQLGMGKPEEEAPDEEIPLVN